MDGFERAGIFDPKTDKRIDVEEAPIVDVARGKPPMAELIMLAFEQMMQCERLCRTIRSSTIGRKPGRNDIGSAWNRFQLRLEGRRLLAIGMAQSSVARSKRKDARARFPVLAADFLADHPQHFALAFGADRQAVRDGPPRETAFAS